MSFWKIVDAIGRIDCGDDLARQIRLRLLVIFTLMIGFVSAPIVAYSILTGSVTGLTALVNIAAVLIFWSILPVLWLSTSIIAASWFMLFVGTSPIVLGAAMSGGANSPIAIYLMIAPVFAGLLLGYRGAITMLVFNGVAVFGLFALSYSGVQFGDPYPPEVTTFYRTLSYLVTLLVLSGATTCFLGLSKYSRRQLELAKLQAEASDRAKGEFLAIMSHEIRTPLNGILGMAEVLSVDTLTDQQRARIGIISESGEGLLAIISDILDVSKLDAGQVELEELVFDPRDVIQSVYDILRVKIDQKALKFAIDIQDDVGKICADPTRVRQILINLIGNATKFTDEGSITVAVSIDKISKGSRTIKFEVGDTGIGIPLEVQSDLFDDFTQADSSTVRRYGGTGLGLAICERLTSLMGGKIGIVSTEGAGATFWFTIEARLPDAPMCP